MVPLVHTIPEACSGAKIGRTALYEAIRSKLHAVKNLPRQRRLELGQGILQQRQALAGLDGDCSLPGDA